MIRTTEQFIEKARKVHGDKYDYSKVEYVNSSTKVCIICPEHGEFWQRPANHLCGQGCPKCCGNYLDKEIFIEKANKIHKNKFCYDKVNFNTNKDKVCIICPEHGEFWQRVDHHLQGFGCSKCSKNYHLSFDEFVEKSNIIYHNKYDYHKSVYKNNNVPICIICPEHGEFWQTPRQHLKGCGCQKCSGKVIDNEIFINKAKKIHGNKYNYSLVNYCGNENEVVIICPIHGEFLQTPHDHLQGCGCPKCSNTISNDENKLSDFIKNDLNLETKQSDRIILNGKELDIYIPDKKIAIEYDGLVWHSEKYGKDKNYHLNKTLECERQGIRLIHIFEDEWLYKKDIVKSKLRHIFCGDDILDKVYARKCSIKEITKNESKIFLNKNHIQGFSVSTVHLGAYYNNELVAVMSFKKGRKDEDNWELTRFATDINKHCIGLGGKLFKYFTRNYVYNEIKSFADRRWTLDKDNNIYTKLGFVLDKILEPDYRYVLRDERIHKFNFRKQILLRHYPNNGLTSDMTEKEMTDKLGFYRIWDCGLFKYIYSNETVK